MNLKNFLTKTYFQESVIWVSETRVNYSANDSVWSFKRDYKKIYKQTVEDLNHCNYMFAPVKKIEFHNKVPVWIWNARDAWVLKALSLYLYDGILPFISKNCKHVKDHGGIGLALAAIIKTDFKIYRFVFKSDVKSFYESMSHDVILRLLHKFIKCRKLHDFFKKFLNHLEDVHAILQPMTIGISKGCPMSPLLGALYLSELDDVMDRLPVIYRRYMDDWIVLTKTRLVLREAIKLTNQILAQLKVQKHPNKTFIGRSDHGFDFLGFHVSAEGIVDFSGSTKEKILSNLHKRYAHPCNGQLLTTYITGVQRWSRGVLRMVSDGAALNQSPDLLTKFIKEMPNVYKFKSHADKIIENYHLHDDANCNTCDAGLQRFART